MQDFLHQQHASIWNLNLGSFNELNNIWRESECCRDDLVKGDFLTHDGWYHTRFRLAQFEHEQKQLKSGNQRHLDDTNLQTWKDAAALSGRSFGTFLFGQIIGGGKANMFDGTTTPTRAWNHGNSARRPDTYFYMHKFPHLRMHSSLLHALTFPSSLVHALTFRV